MTPDELMSRDRALAEGAAKLAEMKFADGGDARGDCMIACLATVLGQPYGPAFDAFHELMNRLAKQRDGSWLSALEAFAAGRGFVMKWHTVPEEVPSGVLTIAGGPSPRGCKSGHSVVMRGAGPAVFHDPHPSRAGLIGEPEEWIWFERIGDEPDLASALLRTQAALALAIEQRDRESRYTASFPEVRARRIAKYNAAIVAALEGNQPTPRSTS